MLRDNQHSSLSLLQRNYLKMLPVVKELHKSLVREEGENDVINDDLDLPSSDEETDMPMPAVIDELDTNF